MTVRVLPTASGTARLTHTLPAQIRAGEPVRFTIDVVPGLSLAAGSTLALARNWPSDWGRPQWTDPEALDYVTATASNGAATALRTARHPAWHPYDHALFVELADPLDEGSIITVAFGAKGSPGIRVQTFVEEECTAFVKVLRAGTGAWEDLGRVVTRVVGSSMERLAATAPSVVTAGQPFKLHVRAEDIWGNPASGVAMDIGLAGGTASGRLTSDAGSWTWLEATLTEPGLHRLVVLGVDGMAAATSNPIRCTATRAEPLQWGDLHAQSAIGCGAQRIESYFEFARDFAAADFAGHQANCFLITNDQWAQTREVTNRLDEEGRFTALLGYEWSGATDLGGDRNIYYPGDTGELRRCGHLHVADRSDLATDLPHVTDLHAHVRGTDTLMAVHVGGRTTNLRWHEASTEKLLEVHSTHATSEWFLFEALRRGYRLGVTGGSDGVDGRPAGSRPGRMSVRNLRGGLTAVMGATRSRASLWAALRERRTYATTGERILLSFTADGHGLGEGYTTNEPPRFAVEIAGTAPLRAVEIFRGVEPIFAAPIWAVDPTPSGEIRVAWGGASGQGNWERARLIFDGRIEIERGEILEARGDVRDTPHEGIQAASSSRVDFTSITAGNWNSVKLRLDEREDTLLRFLTQPITCDVALTDVGTAPFEVTLADPWRLLRIDRLPREPAAADWRGHFIDANAPAGEHAYWVRVRQEDGGCAWSSPIFVTVTR